MTRWVNINTYLQLTIEMGTNLGVAIVIQLKKTYY